MCMTDARFESIKKIRDELGRVKSFRNSASRGYIDIVSEEGMPFRLHKGSVGHDNILRMLDETIETFEKLFEEM